MAKAKQRKHTAHEKAKKEGAYKNKGGGKDMKKARLNPGKTYKCRKFETISLTMSPTFSDPLYAVKCSEDVLPTL